MDDDKQRQHYTEWLRELLGFPIYDRTIEQRVHAASYALHNPQNEGRRRRYTRPQHGHSPEAVEPQTPPDGTPQEEFTSEPGAESQVSEISPSPELTASELEGFLLSLLICDPDLLIWLKGEAQALEVAPLCGNDFQQVEYREIFGALLGFLASDEFWNIELFQEGLRPQLSPDPVASDDTDYAHAGAGTG